MGVLIFIIIVIVVIVIMTKPKDYTPKKGSMQENRIKMQLYQEVDDITTKCFDERTMEFNSDLYFENRFIYEGCGYPEVVEYMKKNLQYIGYRQIYSINLLLETYDPDTILSELQKRRWTILLNLEWICGGGDGKKCPEYIIKYRHELLGMLDGKISCTKENAKRIISEYESNKKLVAN